MTETRKKAVGGEFLIKKASADDVFTPEDLSEEQKMIQRTAREFVEREVLPNNERIENQDFDVVVNLLKKAGELGLLAHSVPEAYGGLGLDKVTKGIVGEMVGRSGSYGVAHSNHTCIATLPITYFGTKEQKEKYLPKLASGEYIGAYCLTEPSSGSDALSAKTTAVLNEDGTHYKLNGSKQWITNAAFSQTFIVYAKVDGKKFTAFIVEKDFPGLSLGPEENKMGIKGSSTRTVILEDCLVPVENVLGEVGKGHQIAFNVLNLGRFNLGSACVGSSRDALQLGVAYTDERMQFGRSIASFNATKEKLADLASRIFAAEAVQYRTAGLLEEALGDLYVEDDSKVTAKALSEFAIECAICKVFGSETLDQAVDEVLQLHGGYGFMKDYRIEQMYRDSRINRIFEGTNEINRLIIPGFLMKKAASGSLNVEKSVKQAFYESQSGTNTGAPGLENTIEAMRRVFLIAAGYATEQFGSNLEEEQETMLKLADLAISLYAAESAVIRALKSGSSIAVKMAENFVGNERLAFELTARKLIDGIGGEKAVHMRELLFNEFSRLVGEADFNRKREIADELIKNKK
ncbi:acyl-CoA dehydrogenase family protein [Pseudalkalibacillus caeni]|uniref:Acyl-CoA dehydrogenase n=1 Tax=Exobacillus caeni TaxID=2574798 RepID=A0A5R9FFE5_9BACL|nr:acyl-CoA dehydrogenase family protein [Pseudalkalibacillus caeni]TLS38295.1 acyl-CoA dehydrogenase [Pseudalkalibacillus caeni]